MSDDVLSVIPTDPHWQPDQVAADRAAAIAAILACGSPSSVDVEIEATWHETLAVVDCGENLERIGCPHCGASIDTEWWADLLEAHCEDGLATLVVEVPCCRAGSTLDALDYEWPCGFARFEIALWNPDRIWFTHEEPAALADALEHPVRQVKGPRFVSGREYVSGLPFRPVCPARSRAGPSRVAATAPGLHGTREWCGCTPSFVSLGLAGRRHVMVGRAVSRCQQVMSASAQGQVASIRSQRWRAWSARRAGR